VIIGQKMMIQNLYCSVLSDVSILTDAIIYPPIPPQERV